jgi:hypothetical protein
MFTGGHEGISDDSWLITRLEFRTLPFYFVINKGRFPFTAP